MPIMVVTSAKALPAKRSGGSSKQCIRERTIIYEGSSGPRELLEAIVIQAQAALKGLEPVKQTDAPKDEEMSEEASESEEEDIPTPSDGAEVGEDSMNVDAAVPEGEPTSILSEQKGERIASPRPLTPPLPLSPISNPSTPRRKRPRSSGWNPPPHVPDFLPPFPSYSLQHSPSPPPISSQIIYMFYFMSLIINVRVSESHIVYSMLMTE